MNLKQKTSKNPFRSLSCGNETPRASIKGNETPCASIKRNENGIVLIAVIVFVAILALFGTVAVMSTHTDIKISTNYKTSKKSFYNTKAAIAEAKARLRGEATGATGTVNPNYAGDSGAVDDDWCAYILTDISYDPEDSGNPGYDDDGFEIHYPLGANPDNTVAVTNTTQAGLPGMSYRIRIRHKREYDAEQAGHTVATPQYVDLDGSTATHTAPVANRGNVIYYGFPDDTYSSPVQFTGPSAKFKPVEIIESYGDDAGSTNNIIEEAVVNPGFPVLGAVYSKQMVDLKGAASSVDGIDDNFNCNPVSPDVPSIYALVFPPEDHTGKGSGPLQNPAYPTTGGDPVTDVTIEDYITILKRGEINITDKLGELEGGVLTWTGPPPISSSTNYQTFYSNAVPFTPGSLLSLTSNESGYGVLLVEGNLKLSGGFEWDGLIVCDGKCRM